MSTNNNNDDESLPCAEKLAFDTKKAAETSALVAKYQHGTLLKTYKCRHCGLWHLASG
ncbi:hypothetical protein KA025_01100 [Candidatus Saccharibacteria bacterium]|jgi:hypothetical protein|nr:hypothetical protein [Candidatus Saccharibacteria bacterium]MBP7834664.1 hypothetical protein [Candidatus Saccharibacteria bacterium]